VLGSEEGLAVHPGDEMQKERWIAEGRDLAEKGGNPGNQSWEVTGAGVDEQTRVRRAIITYPRAIAAKDTVEIGWLCLPVLNSCLCIW